MTYPMTVIDTIFKALAPAIPIASSPAITPISSSPEHQRPQSAGRQPVHLSRRPDRRRLGRQARRETACSATIAINDGDTHNGPSEQVEAKYPLLVERYALREDSGGAGKFRGGLGTEQVVRALDEIRFNAQIDRVDCRPWGLFGGLSALGNGVAIHRFGEAEQRFGNGKAFNHVLQSGDAYIKQSGGGGGLVRRSIATWPRSPGT